MTYNKILPIDSPKSPKGKVPAFPRFFYQSDIQNWITILPKILELFALAAHSGLVTELRNNRNEILMGALTVPPENKMNQNWRQFWR